MLLEYFESFGPVVYARIQTMGRNGPSKGFGFVEFVRESSAAAVLALASIRKRGGGS